MNIINVTPHTLNIHDDNGNITTVEPSGTVARVASTTEIVANVNDIPVNKTVFGDLEDLPPPKDGNVFVASMLVASRATLLGRTDVYSPGSLVRDDSGRPIGCKGLSLPG